MPRVLERLTSSLSGRRERRVRRVTDQEDLISMPAPDRVVVVNPDQVGRGALCDRASDELGPVSEALPEAIGRERLVGQVEGRGGRGRPVGRAGAQRHDPEPLADAPVVPHGHVGEERLAQLAHADPVDEALIDGAGVTVHEPARGRAHPPVRADDEPGRAGHASVEDDAGAARDVRLDPHDATAVLHPDPQRLERLEHDGLQIAPEDRQARVPHQVAEPGHVDRPELGPAARDAAHPARAPGPRLDGREEPQLLQYEGGVRPADHAAAERGRARAALEHLDGEARAPQRDGRGEPGHPRSEDGHRRPLIRHRHRPWGAAPRASRG